MTAPIGQIGRSVPTTPAQTSNYSITPDDYQVRMDATSGNLTATLFTAPGDGAFYEVIVRKTDSSANTVTVTDGTFSFTLNSQNDAITCQLTSDGVWMGVASFDILGAGNMVGPSSATDNAIVRFDGTTGKLVQNSAVTVADTTGVIAGTQGVTLSGSSSGTTALVASAAAGTTTATLQAVTGTIALTSQSLRTEVTADVTNATATMANLTDLTMTLVAAGVYVGEAVFKCADSTAAEGISFDFDGGTATMTAFAAGAGLITGGTTVAVTTVSSALATDLNWTTITGETWLVVKIGLTVNAGGTLIPRFCQGTAHTSGTATTSRGSYLLLNRVS
jgi:hypothetical protein